MIVQHNINVIIMQRILMFSGGNFQISIKQSVSFIYLSTNWVESNMSIT